MSRTFRKVPHWAKKDTELSEKFRRGKVNIPIASGSEPFEEAEGKKGKRLAKKVTRRARRRGKAPINFKK